MISAQGQSVRIRLPTGKARCWQVAIGFSLLCLCFFPASLAFFSFVVLLALSLLFQAPPPSLSLSRARRLNHPQNPQNPRRGSRPRLLHSNGGHAPLPRRPRPPLSSSSSSAASSSTSAGRRPSHAGGPAALSSTAPAVTNSRTQARSLTRGRAAPSPTPARLLTPRPPQRSPGGGRRASAC